MKSIEHGILYAVLTVLDLFGFFELLAFFYEIREE